MSTSIIIQVNQETYEKYHEILDAKELVSATQITHNFLDGALLKMVSALLNEEDDYINFYSKIGRDNVGTRTLNDIYIPSSHPYEYLVFSRFGNLLDQADLFRGCLVAEIDKQFKMFCRRKRGRTRRSYNK